MKWSHPPALNLLQLNDKPLIRQRRLADNFVPRQQVKMDYFAALGVNLGGRARSDKKYSMSSVVWSSFPLKIKMRYCRVPCKHQPGIQLVAILQNFYIVAEKKY
jgi:hypothetical protein